MLINTNMVSLATIYHYLINLSRFSEMGEMQKFQPSHSFPAASDVLSSTPVSLRGGDRLEHDPRAHEKHRLMVGFKATLPQKSSRLSVEPLLGIIDL